MKKSNQMETAIFAGGCFWGIEEGMRRIAGVVSAESGYIGGTTEDPIYKEVRTGRTGHAEAVRVVFDPREITYEGLLRCFFEMHDPTQVDRQGADVGTQYRSEIFYLSPRQKRAAEFTIAILRRRGWRVATRITAASKFYRAEEYHQQYYEKSGYSPCAYYAKRF